MPVSPESAGKIRLLIVEDHIVMRMGLVTATSDQADMEVVAEVESGREAFDAYRRHLPDVVILDLQTSGLRGLETIKLLRADFSDARILILSGCARWNTVVEAIEAGANGFVPKEMSVERLVGAIRKVYRGEACVSD